MREILFRGKRTDGGEWVYGYPVGWQNEGGDISIVDSRFGACIDESGNLMMLEAPFVAKVDPATIGQYTGLTDKDGVKIFEGDVVERKGVGVWEDYVNEKGEKWSRSTNRKKDERGIIRYDEDVTQFTPDNPCIWLGHYDDIEVIGNIFDNPELLKEATWHDKRK